MEYQPYNTTVVAYQSPVVNKIVPKSGPRAGKETFVVEFKAYHPTFERKEDGSYERKDSTFYTVQYFGSEKVSKGLAQHVKEGMTLEIRGDVTQKSFQGKDGEMRTENVISAKGIALSLTQPGISIQFEKPKAKTQER